MYFFPKRGIFRIFRDVSTNNTPKTTFNCIFINKFPKNFEKSAQKLSNFEKSAQNFFAAPSTPQKTLFSSFLPPPPGRWTWWYDSGLLMNIENLRISEIQINSPDIWRSNNNLILFLIFGFQTGWYVNEDVIYKLSGDFIEENKKNADYTDWQSWKNESCSFWQNFVNYQLLEIVYDFEELSKVQCLCRKCFWLTLKQILVCFNILFWKKIYHISTTWTQK